MKSEYANNYCDLVPSEGTESEYDPHCRSAVHLTKLGLSSEFDQVF